VFAHFPLSPEHNGLLAPAAGMSGGVMMSGLCAADVATCCTSLDRICATAPAHEYDNKALII
jgi:hypothetical protein